MKRLLILVSLLIALGTLPAAVIRPAADFTFPGVGNKIRSLRSLRGQAVVLLIAGSPRERAFRKQLRYLEEVYQQFASKQVVFVAALRSGEGPVKTDIPFAVANNGAAVAGAYEANNDFQLVIIGADGNVDYQTDEVRTGERIRDVIQNSFAVQAAARKR